MAFIINQRYAIIFAALFFLSTRRVTHQSVVVNHDLSPALSELFLDYDSNVRPPAAASSPSSASIVVGGGGGEKPFSNANGPTKIETSLHVQQIWRQNDQTVLVVVLTQKWRDDRLEFKSPDQLKAKYAVLADKIWTPDTFPMDAVRYSTLHDGYYQITGNGTVRLSKVWKFFLLNSINREFNISNKFESKNLSDSFQFGGQKSNGSKMENSNENANFSNSNSSIEITTKDEDDGANFGHTMMMMKINLVSFVYDSGEVEFSCRAMGHDNCLTMNPDIRNKFRYFECSTFSKYWIGDRIHSSFGCSFDLV